VRAKGIPDSEPDQRAFGARKKWPPLLSKIDPAVSRWHEEIGDPGQADGILNPLVDNAHRIEMRVDSMGRNRGKLDNCRMSE
jgi:hypothetical protein